MKLPLQVPICAFDTETTGTNSQEDRIVQIAVIKIYPDGTRKTFEQLFNPEIPIPAEATEVHHITDEMVKDAPPFAVKAEFLAKSMDKCDYLGFNIPFDVKILQAEFKRANVKIDMSNGRLLDAMKIFQRYEKRDLSSAVKFYLGREHVGAHGALADIEASLEVFETQLERYPDLPQSVEGLYSTFFEIGENGLDPDGKVKWKSGLPVLGFGKHAGKSLQELVKRDRQYLAWLHGSADTTPALRKILGAALDGKFPVKS